jgi:hypothetical protein
MFYLWHWIDVSVLKSYTRLLLRCYLNKPRLKPIEAATVFDLTEEGKADKSRCTPSAW